MSRFILDEKPFRRVDRDIIKEGRYQAISFWQDTVDIRPGAPLEGETSCDVAVVGGGFTGLSVARELKKAEPSLDVVVLERIAVGHGASGRNCGFAVPVIGMDLSDAAAKLGEKGCKEAYELTYRAMDHLRDTIKEEGIACDMEETGFLLLATCGARERRLREHAALAQRLGFGIEWIDEDGLADFIRSDSFCGGAYDARPFLVNPVKLARGLMRDAAAKGVRFFEQTPVVELREGSPLTMRTPGGSVTAKCGVLCLNGYGGALGFQRRGILPINVYTVLTEPLSDAEVEGIGWAKRRTSLEVNRNLIHAFRLTADNRILFAGEDGVLYFRGRYEDTNTGVTATLKRRLKTYFPSLANKAFTHEWGGLVGVALDVFPTFGRSPGMENLFHAAGYGGTGVSLGNYAGVLLTPHILKELGLPPNRALEEPFFFNKQPFRFPAEPIAYAGMQAYIWGLKVQDSWQGA